MTDEEETSPTPWSIHKECEAISESLPRVCCTVTAEDKSNKPSMLFTIQESMQVWLLMQRILLHWTVPCVTCILAAAFSFCL